MPFYRRQLIWQDLEHNSNSRIFRAVSYEASIFRCFPLTSSLGSPSPPFWGARSSVNLLFLAAPLLSFLAQILCDFYILLLFPAFQTSTESLPADPMGLETGNLCESVAAIFFEFSLESKGYFGIGRSESEMEILDCSM